MTIYRQYFSYYMQEHVQLIIVITVKQAPSLRLEHYSHQLWFCTKGGNAGNEHEKPGEDTMRDPAQLILLC